MATLSVGLEAKTGAAASLDFDALPRTYESALHLLSLLPTNRDVTSLFEAPVDNSGKPFDYNSLAIPEVVAWMGRAGYSDLPKDLAPLKCIHIAGTKGKGSVCAFATAILVEASRAEAGSPAGRVGTYLSPHVVSVRERIWLDGQPISRELFTKYTFEMWKRLSEGAAAADPSDPDPYGPHTKPFYFRFLTLLALHVFLREGVRSAVIECGIGGEYDATNVLPASSVTATAVTRLGIDHVAMLGRSLEEIAWHKSGIFKEGVAAFTLQGPPSSSTSSQNGQDGESAENSADQSANSGSSAADQDAALAVLRARAVEKKAEAHTLYEVSPQSVQAWEGVPDAALTGSFQKYNMALAAAVARCHLREMVSTGSDEQKADINSILDPATIPSNFREALTKASLRGRCEVVSSPLQGSQRSIEYLIDGAHTTDSLSKVARFFAKKTAGISPRPRRTLLFSVRDRNPGELLRAVIAGVGQQGFFHAAYFVFPPDAPLLIEDVRLTMQEVSPTTPVVISGSVHDAIGRINALEAADTSHALSGPLHVLAAGSFVLAREVLQELEAHFEE
ncbi:folylpolyglutamate synthase [Ophiostoma piceae UAMH 11346]|uniref:tetrahydrofolate synthase n=1 Tax=Ophiostoma piceae (strain UAMH 11346) TaxID=1262450 RepID=S3CSF3_OPHP1|nr:folylpolyglutamate synthase [Ophiostoma piceae UAMH 11346]